MSWRRYRPTLLILPLALLVGTPHPGVSAPQRRAVGTADQAAAFGEQRQALQAKFGRALQELARWCDDQKLPAVTQELRDFARKALNESSQHRSLPAEVQPEIPLNLPENERHARTQLRKLRQEHAAALYRLSREALHRGLPTLAYQLVRDVAFYDPDHEMARRFLGYVRYSQQTDDGPRLIWTTPFTAEKLRRNEVWHDRFGWLPKEHVPRYEAGERYYLGRWISAAQEAELRRDFSRAWEIRTEHYLVKTNYSLERGVELAAKLEEFHGFFRELYAGFFEMPEQMLKLFAGSRRALRLPDPYIVHYYRTRGEYLERLAGKIPQIAETNGLYYTSDRTAYFYDDPEGNNDATLYHEASHQLFYESQPAERPVGEAAHFWVVEGIACYMESFSPSEGQYALGDPGFIRFHWARHRLLEEEYYVPLVQFCALGQRQFQDGAREDLQKRYSQASGLAHFFMHYDGGRYREALVQHLLQLYTADPRRPQQVQTLWELTGVAPGQLDAQYTEHMRHMETAARQVDSSSGASTASGARNLAVPQ